MRTAKLNRFKHQRIRNIQTKSPPIKPFEQGQCNNQRFFHTRSISSFLQVSDCRTHIEHVQTNRINASACATTHNWSLKHDVNHMSIKSLYKPTSRNLSISIPFSTDTGVGIGGSFVAQFASNDHDEQEGETTSAKATLPMQNDALDKKLEDLSLKQLELLEQFKELAEGVDHLNGNQNNDNDDGEKDDKEETSSSSSNDSKAKALKQKYDGIWQIAHHMDNLIHKQNVQSRTSNNHHLNTVIKTWKVVVDAYHIFSSSVQSSGTNTTALSIKSPRGLPQRATTLLETMEKNLEKEYNTSTDALSIETYNNVLEMWALSHEPHSNTRADSIFRRINNGNSNNFIEPNADTLRIMIRELCQICIGSRSEHVNTKLDIVNAQKKGNPVFQATGHLMKMQALLENGSQEYEPSLEDYLMIFKAWGAVADKRNSAKRALNILRKMENLNMNRFTEVKPNAECYKYVLKAISGSRPKFMTDMGELVEILLSDMEKNGLTPDSECFSYAIRTCCKEAHYNSSPPQEVYDDALRAHSILEQMENMYYRSGSVVIRPTSYDYNNVIKAWSMCTINDAAERAETLLTKMENKYNDGDALLMPTKESYVNVITACWQYPTPQMQIDKTMSIFERMLLQYKNGNHSCKPCVESYNRVISVCSSNNFIDASDEDKSKSLKCVLDMVNRMRQSNEVELNSKTYHLLLVAFGTLLEKDSQELAKSVESIFSKCCSEGLVNNKVLRSFKRLAPNDVYRRCVLLNAVRDFASSDGLYLPLEWTRYVDGNRPIVPFTMEGNSMHKQYHAVQEHKMRRLRKRKNQQLLRGGRMK